VRSFQRKQKPMPKKGETPLISVKNVSAAYGPVKVLDDVSFDIHRGRTVAVVGESGSGKSTTAPCITGLLPPTDGQILFEGEIRCRALSRPQGPAQLRQAQMIYQMADTALNPKKKIGEIIARPLQFYSGLTGADLKKRVDLLLDEIELEPSLYYHRFRPSFRAGRSSASASPGRWPQTPPSSSVTR
jgi:peptide/nickel transport system ATP-binding protein